MPRLGVGIGLGQFSGGGGGSAYDADAQAFFDRVSTAGGSLSTIEKSAVNQLVLDLKSYSIWTKMKAIYPMVGASAAACAQNLKSSSFTGTFNGGWTYASTGITGNGTSGYMNTGLNDLNDLGANATIAIYVNADGIQTTNWLLGVYSSPTISGMSIANAGSGNYINIKSGVSSIYGQSYIGGLFLGTTNGTTNQVYKNATNKGNNSQTTTGLNLSHYIGALNSNGTSILYDDKRVALVSYSNFTFTGTDVSNFYTAVQTFNQSLSRQVGAQIVSDPDAQAFVNRVYNAGGTLTNTEANAVNQLTIDLKSIGVWSSMKAIYPMVGASAAACAQNLKSSSFTGTFSGGWTYASSGVTPNGTSGYMNTGFVPSTDFSSSTSFGLFLYTSSTTASNNARDLGAFTNSGVPSFSLTSKDQTSSKTDLYDYANRISVSGYNVEGFYIGSRTASNSAKLYRNGTSIGTTTGAAGTAPSIYITLGGVNNSSSNPITSVIGFDSKTFSIAGFCDGLTDTEASNFYTAVQTFQTTLSRQV